MTRFRHKFSVSTMCAIVLVLAFASQAPTALAATITVDPHGSGDHLNIQDALFAAQHGDEVVVMPGVYLENLIMTSGVRLSSLEGPEHTIIDGQGHKCFEAVQCAPGTAVIGFTVTNGGSMQGGAFWVFDNSYLEIADNVISNCRVGYEGAGVHAQRYSYANIHGNQFHNNSSPMTAAISVIVHSSADIRSNVFRENSSENRGAAIGVHESHVEVVDNFFVDNRGGVTTGNVDFYKATGLVSNNVFQGNTSTEAGASCVAIRHASSRVTVVRNVFAHNPGGPALLTVACQAVSCNIFWGNTSNYAGLCPPVGQDNNIEADPRLCAEHPGFLMTDSPGRAIKCGPIGFSNCSECDH